MISNLHLYFALSAFCIWTVVSSDLLSFNLVRRERNIDYRIEKAKDMNDLEQILSQHDNDSVPLFHNLDNEFYGEVLIGHPGQKFKVLFDTSWANSWVASAQCDVKDIFCANHTRYVHDKSSTYVPDGRKITIPYGNSSFIGFISTDLVHMGHSNITSQSFAEMTQIPPKLSLGEADGVFGLAFSSISYLGVTSFLDNLYSQGRIKKKIFSFYFNRDLSSRKGGTLFFGGSQSKHYVGNFTYVNLMAADYWRFEINSIHIKGLTDDICNNTKCPTIIDTSSIAISGPAQAIELIHHQIGARKFQNFYVVDCGTFKHLKELTINIGGRNFILKSRDYVRRKIIAGNEFCITVFKNSNMPTGFDNYWTLGVSFMARFYPEFDAENKKIGFADTRF